jgi:uncharacterized protein (TIGR00297 family)
MITGTVQDYLLLSFIVIAAIISVIAKKLTIAGGLAGIIVAIGIYWGSGIRGIAALATFFILGTLATSWGKRAKKKIGLDDNHGGRRTAGQVLANGGVAALAGYLAYKDIGLDNALIIMMYGSLSSATADTLSSELGTLYGKRFYNILTFRKDIRGENGVVSLEGTLIGIIGSCIIATIAVIGIGFGGFWKIVVAGTVGNIVDSILGATLERKGIIKNNAVNLLNTMIAALTAYLLFTY